MPQLDASTVLIFSSVFLLSIWLLRRRRGNIPPGPKTWPVIGNIPEMKNAAQSKTLHKHLFNLAQEYGSVFTIQLGPQMMVFLNDYQTVKELFLNQGDTLALRPLKQFYFFKRLLGDTGVIFKSGPQWKSLRRFTLVALRDFGVGKKTIEQRIKDEVSALITVISNFGDEAFVPWSFLPKAVSNIICSICFGNRFDYTDERFVELLTRLKFSTSNLNIAVPINVFPWLRYVPFQGHMEQAIVENFDMMNKFIDDQIEAHKADFDPNNLRDFVDLHLQKEQEGHGDDEAFSRGNMRGLVRDLFIAGTDTTATTLNWAFAILTSFPAIQKKCQDEIDRVIGRSRLPSSDDRQSMPFMEAVMHEVMRVGSVVPFGVPHCTYNDVTIHGYTIPKDTIVFANLYAVHRDSKTWADAEEFKPERWLKDGKFVRHEELIPFSMGPRTCMGETLARMEIFLFLTSFLQQFTFEKENPNDPTVNLQGQQGIVLSPKPYKIRAKQR